MYVWFLEIFNARFHTLLLYTSEFYWTVIHSWTFGTSQIVIVTNLTDLSNVPNQKFDVFRLTWN